MDNIREVKIPGDKSISHRSIMLSSLSEGKIIIDNILLSEDVLMTINAFRDLGVSIEIDEKKKLVKVSGLGLRGLKKASKELYMGNSGTSMRLMAGILAAQKFPSVLVGDESLNKRPMKRIIEPIRLMGGDIRASENGRAPLYIHPVENLKAIDYKMPVASAQVKSAILLASLYADGDSLVLEENKSRDHTERMIEYFKDNNWRPDSLYIPSDISSASYFIVYGLFKEDICMKSVGINPSRTGIIDLVKSMGGRIEIKNIRRKNNEDIGDIYVYKSKLSPFDIDGDIVVRLIDEIPILAVMASLIEGRSSIRGSGELRVKETDRINALCRNLEALGVDLIEYEDGMVIRGCHRFKKAQLSSFGDHRIAMAFEILFKIINNGSSLLGKEVVEISFPDFYKALEL